MTANPHNPSMTHLFAKAPIRFDDRSFVVHKNVVGYYGNKAIPLDTWNGRDFYMQRSMAVHGGHRVMPPPVWRVFIDLYPIFPHRDKPALRMV